MQSPDFPDNERQRLIALNSLGILDTPDEAVFDRVTRIAQQALSVKTVLISLLDANRQWFKSRQGLDATETPRAISFCGHAILGDELFEIHDALADPRFADNPLVTGEPHLRFYAGVPLRSRAGYALGTLCLIDYEPRQLTTDEKSLFIDLAELAQAELRRREEQGHVQQKTLVEGTRAGVCEWNIQTGAAMYNERWAEIVGYTLAELEPVSKDTWLRLVHPDDLDTAKASLRAHLDGDTPLFELICRMRHKAGHWVWVQDRGKVISWTQDGSPEWMMGTHQDISELKEIESRRQQADRALQNRERLLRTIIDNIPMNIYVKDRSGRKILANRAELDHLGIADEAEVLGKHDRDLYATHLAERSVEEDSAVLERGESIFLTESEGADQNGNPLWYRMSKVPLRDQDGEIAGLVGLSIDVTDESNNKHSLSRQLNFLQVLNGISTESQFSLDERLDRALSLGSEHLGLELGIISQIEAQQYRVRRCQVPDQVPLKPGDTFALGDTFCSLVLLNDGELVIQSVAGSPYAQHPCYELFGVETYVGIRLTVNGRVFGTLNFSSATPLAKSLDESDLAFVRLLGRWVESALERDEAQLLLRQREARLSVLFELSPLGIALTDLSTGDFLEVNDSLLDQTGYSRDDLLAMNQRELSASLSRFIDQEGLQNATDKEHIGPVEASVRHRNGHKYPVNVVGMKATEIDGTSLLWIVYEDISDRRRIERLKNDLVSSVSHELRTPLTSISGSLKLLGAGHLGGLPEPATKMVNIALKNTERLILLVNDLLDMDKLIADRMPFDVQPASLQHLLTTTRDNIAGYAHQHNVTISLGEIPSANVHVDVHRFEQVMANLLSNAIKFSPDGEAVGIEASLASHSVTVRVRDRGPGIPDEFKPHIFQRFSQAGNRADRQKGGTGLGLAISLNIMQKMGGDIRFESRPGLTEFQVLMPRA